MTGRGFSIADFRLNPRLDVGGLRLEKNLTSNI